MTEALFGGVSNGVSFVCHKRKISQVDSMGRPSVQAQRKEEILRAFEICVAKFGVEGATLERIAEEAGLARPLIRHHMGNREEIIDALAERFLARWDETTEALISSLPEPNRAEALVNSLFDARKVNWEQVLVAEALIASSSTRPQLAEQLGKWVQSFVSLVGEQIQMSYPDAKKKSVRVVATGIVGIYFNVDSLEPLGAFKTLRADSKEAAKRLLNSL